MPWGVAAAAVAAGGAYMSSQNAAKGAASAAQSQADAARYSSDAQVRAAEIAAEQAKFRPVGMSTRFGTSTFTKDEEGNIKEAGYTLSPELKAMQDFAMQQAQAGQADTTGLLSLGRGYLATSPEAAAQDYMAKQRALYAPGREQQLAALRNQQLQTGRAGLATGGTTGGMAATNPEMAAYYNALAQQEAQLAANADQAAQQRITFGQGLLSSAYSPMTTPLGVAGTMESLGQGAFDLGVNLGGRQTQANQAAAQMYQTGMTNAANTLAAGQARAAQTLQPSQSYSALGAGLTGLGQQLGNTNTQQQLGSWFNNMIGGSDSWNTSGDMTYFGSNSSGTGAGEGYSGMNTELGL
jgi:hypothetical protein